MLLRSDEPTTFVERRKASRRAENVTVQEDVEQLIRIAGQLYSTIERQIQGIEKGLAMAEEESDSFKSQTVLKEHLIRTALSLNESLHAVAVRLEERTERSALLEHSHAIPCVIND
jgi:hypothetical protein